MSSVARSILDFFIVFFVTLSVLAIFVSDVFIFRARSPSYSDQNLPGIIKITTSDGAKISAIHYDNPDA